MSVAGTQSRELGHRDLRSVAGTLSRFGFILSFGKAQTTHHPPIFPASADERAATREEPLGRPPRISRASGRGAVRAPVGFCSGYVGILGKLLRLRLEPGDAANALESCPALDWSCILCPIPSPGV